MVWGMFKSSGFGDYFPLGDFVGWREKLQAYFNGEMPVELNAKFGREASYCNHVATKFTSEPGRVVENWPPLGPVLDHEWPTEYATEKSYEQLGSLIMLPDRLFAVDETLKEIIVRLEPGVHSFHRIIISMPRGAVYQQRFYTMVIGHYLDSFDPEQSEPGSWRGTPGYYHTERNTKKSLSGLALSKCVVGDAHLWRERELLTPNIYFSDALQDEISKAGLRIPKHFRLKEV